jgi:hypothetical protein
MVCLVVVHSEEFEVDSGNGLDKSLVAAIKRGKISFEKFTIFEFSFK